jgi:hypothetical protein
VGASRRGHQCRGFPVSKQRYGMGWQLSVRAAVNVFQGLNQGFHVFNWSKQGRTPQKSISRCGRSLQGLDSMGTWQSLVSSRLGQWLQGHQHSQIRVWCSTFVCQQVALLSSRLRLHSSQLRRQLQGPSGGWAVGNWCWSRS